ncbi:ABC transporter ATP-binding protein [Haladaptatus sp. F3-133]|uniref:ABC transporter ATP-binding protein n=1 Tax=Halorutilus salinus TaxID=2487751 RepID=A0A9Q4C3Q5_9EURY|nr:ABC transporter ATP-binding protein [Halorutilus salinus]MCX2818868.1 ABC transporter ATP-binding protein [Halorutilus salinus]
MNKTESAAVLEANDVSKTYGELEVLKDVSMEAERGRVYALIGPNGSGKTTFLKILAGLLPPDSGEVLRRTGGAERAVGYLPQQPSFRDGFTVAETLRFYTRLLDEKMGDGYVSEALGDVGLSDASDRHVSGLSGGMTRLLGVAQSRVGNPPIMVVDEPTSGLDPEMTGRIFETLGGIADDGTAVFLTTHDLDRVARHADEVVLIHDRRIAGSGSPDEVVNEHEAESLASVFDSVVRGGGRG